MPWGKEKIPALSSLIACIALTNSAISASTASTVAQWFLNPKRGRWKAKQSPNTAPPPPAPEVGLRYPYSLTTDAHEHAASFVGQIPAPTLRTSNVSVANTTSGLTSDSHPPPYDSSCHRLTLLLCHAQHSSNACLTVALEAGIISQTRPSACPVKRWPVGSAGRSRLALRLLTQRPLPWPQRNYMLCDELLSYAAVSTRDRQPPLQRIAKRACNLVSVPYRSSWIQSHWS